MTKPLDKAPVPIVKVAMPPREQLMPLLEEVLYGGMIGEGDHVYDFEARFASHFGLSNTLEIGRASCRERVFSSV